MPEEIIPGREVPHYLSLPQFADRLGLKGDTLRKYKLPPRDITWGDGFPGWSEKTIDEWDANRPRKRRVPRPGGEGKISA